MERRIAKALSLILSAGLAVAALAGCGAPNTPSKPDAKASEAAKVSQTALSTPAETKPGTEAESGPIDVTDLKGDKIHLEHPAKRVVVTFNLEEYLAVAGKEGVNTLVGFPHKYWKGRRQDAWDAYTKALPELAKKTDIGYSDALNIETVISLKPDIILASAPVNYKQFEPHLKQLKEAGIPIAFFDFHAQTLEKTTKSIDLIGAVLGKSERAKELADYYTKQVKLVEDRIAKLPADAHRPRVYMEFSLGPNKWGNSWSDIMWGAMIKQAGGVNIAAGMEGKTVQVAPEQVLAKNPEVVIFTASPRKDVDDNVVLGYGTSAEAARKALAGYEKRPGWSSLDAVKNHRLAALYHDLSRHIFDFAGLQFLAKEIQPELFKDLDPQANLQDFFNRFMPVKLEGSWMVDLQQQG